MRRTSRRGPNFGNDLARRPQTTISVSADYRLPFGLSLGATVRQVGDSFDDAANLVRLDGYVVTDIRAEMPVGKHFAIYGRIENLFDEQYQTVAGYGTYGRAAYGGSPGEARLMRRAIPLLLLALAGCTAPARAPGGGGIVSTNPCADAILIELVPAARIAAISHYSQDPAATSIPIEVARRFRSTAGTAEEVIALAPDLVLTSSFTPASTRNAYARAGLKTLLLDSPTTIDASRTQIAEMAQAVGAPERGRALIERIDRAVAAAVPESADRPAALLFIAGNLVNGSGTLLDELLDSRRLSQRRGRLRPGLYRHAADRDDREPIRRA